ncbi:class I SAM-dependent methyltransferase [Desulfoluna spongiiphila]|uniref:Methyltransferase domain-containing protein n=1 Tax=Desulfoluna spongiiphila TaxID=419481 RepID=A0A1G5F6Y5_9BACT|nr:methyltransferase domain-containing protein [Desulfoluna spongiiphila]SCY34995.1 Methyltransferase domain-containing protein [Desulfoluna spongiiphila]
MKRWLQEKLICPECAPAENPLSLTATREEGDDVLEGELTCLSCQRTYGIEEGVAVLLPESSMDLLSTGSGYNSKAMLSSYLWSHFSEFFNGTDATDAYRTWSSYFKETDGWALDIGCSVGRLSFELSKTHSRVVGMDTSLSFIKKARQLLKQKRLEFELIVEGHMTEQRGCTLDRDWNYDRVEFVVADAMALPFQRTLFSTATSINVLEKVPQPLHHLANINHVLKDDNAMFVFSDPFSWDEGVSDPGVWLSGRTEGPFTGRGIDNISRLMAGDGGTFHPPFEILDQGDVDWKIRKTENLWEHITSQFLVGVRHQNRR